MHKQAAWGWDVMEAMWEVKTQIEARKKFFMAQAPEVEEGKEWFAYFSRLMKIKRKAMNSLVGVGVQNKLNKGML